MLPSFSLRDRPNVAMIYIKKVGEVKKRNSPVHFIATSYDSYLQFCQLTARMFFSNKFRSISDLVQNVLLLCSPRKILNRVVKLSFNAVASNHFMRSVADKGFKNQSRHLHICYNSFSVHMPTQSNTKVSGTNKFFHSYGNIAPFLRRLWGSIRPNLAILGNAIIRKSSYWLQHSEQKASFSVDLPRYPKVFGDPSGGNVMLRCEYLSKCW